MMQDILEIGMICNTHGVSGNIKLIPWTDYPEIFEDLDYIIINDVKYEIVDVKYQKANVILKFKGINTMEQAEKLKNFTAYCYKNQLADLEEDNYYIADLIGCEVYEEENVLGKVTDVIPAGGADLYEIKSEGKSAIYLPAIKENILKIDIKNKIINVKLPEGLI